MHKQHKAQWMLGKNALSKWVVRLQTGVQNAFRTRRLWRFA